MSEDFDLSVLDDEIDIPEMERDLDPYFGRSPVPKAPIGLFVGIGGVVILSIGAIAVWQILLQRNQVVSAPVQTAQTTPTNPATTTPSDTENGAEQLLGHFAYDEAPANQLVTISTDNRFKLRSVAAAKFEQMQADARRDGVQIVLISGFRSIEEQKYLFFKVKEQRAQDATKRAEVSAPPHYSEHHTGYALDVGDANSSGANLNQSFDQTAAFQWLHNNAARYSFELSFPKNNAQGVSYEPWHWRFVGDQDSLETFYKSRNLSQVQTKP